MPPKPTHLLLDFFGTVVEYSPSRTAQGYERTHDLTTRMGSTLTYDESRAAWSAAFDRLERETSMSLDEFSSHQVAQLALQAILGRAPDAHEIQVSAQSYQDDWSQGIRYPNGMLDVLRQLSDRFTLTIVSNTHDANLVQSHLDAMGADHFFETVVTSIDVGRRKPHPVIFETALDTLGVGPADALFVGDTYLADYVGPERSGIRAFLIDPARIEHVPAAHRIDSLAKLASHLDQQGLT
jgi:putative hydrolase of the HAD superfamily